MITQKDIDLIDRYLSGNLSPEEIISFESRKASDKEFSEEVQFLHDLKVGIRQAKRIDLKKKLKQISDEYENNNLGKNSSGFYYAIAATIAIIIATVGIIYFIKSQKNNPEFAESADTLKAESQKFNIEKYLAENTTITGNKIFIAEKIGNPGFGYANTDTLKIEVIFIKDEKYLLHYYLKDKLYLFGNLDAESIKLFELKSAEKNSIILKYHSEFYEIPLANIDALNPLIEAYEVDVIKKIEK